MDYFNYQHVDALFRECYTVLREQQVSSMRRYYVRTVRLCKNESNRNTKNVITHIAHIITYHMTVTRPIVCCSKPFGPTENIVSLLIYNPAIITGF